MCAYVGACHGVFECCSSCFLKGGGGERDRDRKRGEGMQRVKQKHS